MSSITDTSTTTDPHAVAASTFERFAQAWNAADGAALGTLFADETDFVNIRGEHHRGDGVAIGHGHQVIFDTIYKGSTLAIEVDVARSIAPGVIVAVATTALDNPAGPPMGAKASRITATFVQEAGEWKVTAFENTLVFD